MFGTIWEFMNPHYYFIIAIPCMSMFSFRFKRKYRLPAILLTILAVSVMRLCTQSVLSMCFHHCDWWPNFLVDQSIYVFYLIIACCCLYKGNKYSMVLTIFLAMSLAAQCGFIIGGLLNTFIGAGYGIEWVILRDVLGYGTFALYYSTLWKYSNFTSFYLSRKDHLILLGVALINYLLTCCFTKIFLIGSLTSILFYVACAFTTCSVTFLIFRFTKDHQQAQEQQMIIQDMKLSENTLTQIQASATQMKELKHELSNYFIYAEQLLQNKEYKALSDYLSSVADASIPTTKTVVTSNSVVDSIINQKSSYAKSLGIRTDFQIALPEHLPIDDLTLCSLFGNLLNNAIEACKEQKGAFIRMHVWPAKSYLILKTDNSVTYDIIKENPQLLTTKEDAEYHGNGMKILQKIAERYDGIIHYEMTGTSCFTVQIMLKLYN